MDVKLIYTSSNRLHTSLPKAIAFDLDETIGSFSDFYSLWARLDDDMKTQNTFNEIMDLYPEFFRIGILSILRYIRTKQESGHCLPIHIYTNNQCEDVNWIYRLIEYLESHVVSSRTCGYNTPKLFARPICAFKIRGTPVELCRTTHEKTYSDFVKCSMLSTSHELCFVDDAYHRKMKHKRVYYIQPPPYVHSVPYQEVIRRFVNSKIYKKLYPGRADDLNCIMDDRMDAIFCQQNASPELVEIAQTSPLLHRLVEEEQEEQRISNKIMYHIREFFLIASRKSATKKRKYKICNFTRKRIAKNTYR